MNGNAPQSLAAILIESIDSRYGDTEEAAHLHEVSQNAIATAYAGKCPFFSHSYSVIYSK